MTTQTTITQAQDIQSIERQIAMKQQYLPRLEASDLSEEMKQKYLAGIEELREILKKLRENETSQKGHLHSSQGFSLLR